jgi:hypothetical protein
MPARSVPTQPSFRSQAERAVWTMLRRTLRDVDALLANVGATGEASTRDVTV